MKEFEWTDYNNMRNVEKIETILNSNLHKDLGARVQLEQTISDCSKYLYLDNSTEFVVGMLSSIATMEQLRVLVSHLQSLVERAEKNEKI